MVELDLEHRRRIWCFRPRIRRNPKAVESAMCDGNAAPVGPGRAHRGASSAGDQIHPPTDQNGWVW